MSAPAGKRVPGKRKFVLQTLERGLSLLEWTIAHPGDATVRRAAEALELEENTAYRLINTLVAAGYLVREKRGSLIPGPGFLRLWPVYLQPEGFSPRLLAVVRALRDSTQESTFLGVWDGEDLVLVSSLDGMHHLRITGYGPGYRGFTHARATGKVVLAYLERADLDRYLETHKLEKATEATIADEEELRAQLETFRAQGVAYEYEELFHGACAIAAPLFGPRGEIVGGVAISVPASRFEAHLEDFRASMIASGEEASRILGYRGPYPKSSSPEEPQAEAVI